MKRILFVLAAVAAFSAQAFAANVTMTLTAAIATVHQNSSGQLIQIYAIEGYQVDTADGNTTSLDTSTSNLEQVGAKLCDYSKPWQVTKDNNLYCIAK